MIMECFYSIWVKAPDKLVIAIEERFSNLAIHHNVGTCLRHVSMQSTMYKRLGNMPKARALKKSSFLKTKTKNAYDL